MTHAKLKIATYALVWGCLWPSVCFAAEDDATNARPDDRIESRFGVVFQQNCAVCHGDRLTGGAQGSALVGGPLKHGDTMADLTRSITHGYADMGMPAWGQVFTDQEIKSLALWISEYRSGLLYSDFKISSELSIPDQPISTQHYDIELETIATGLDPLPYSIEPLPDGSILVTEKMRGLRMVSPTGEVSELISGTPQTYDDARSGGGGLEYGMGWLLDVAAHPNYANNGWVYLHYTDRCRDCNDTARELDRPVSMNALIRGRIRDNEWQDEEVIWKAALADYSPSSDVATGGRIAFDPEGFIFISIGMQSIAGIQNLNSAHGKVLRLHDDGRIPADNPFVDNPKALNEIWSYGHRSPQGLEFDATSGVLWETEHGPRGGDEINHLKAGGNYGWPLFSKGQNYDGSEVAWGKKLGLETELKDVEQPIVDLTPSPAISSFIIYDGEQFPVWQGDFIVGSLKAADVFRVTLQDKKLIHQETIIQDLARIRDIEIGMDGELLLLLEHASGGKIVRVRPADKQHRQTIDSH